MPWRRWSVSRAALRAVTGQFVGRQTVLSAAILCALAAWFGASTDLRVNPRVAVTGLVLAAVGLTATIASTWIGSGRWDDLARFPLRRDELARATYLVADAVVLLEAVAPIVLFVLLTGGGGSGRSPGMGMTATTAAEMVAVGLGAGALGLILWAGERIWLRWTAAGALVVGTLLWWLAPAASALLFAVCALAAIVCSRDLRVRRRQVGTVGGGRRSLVLGELTTVRTTQVNTLIMLVVALVFTYVMAGRGLSIPMTMAFVVVNTPLNAYFSRYLSTRAVVMAAPGSRRVFVAYARDLTLLYLMSNCLVGALVVWLGGGLVEAVAAGVAASLAGASTAVLLENYWPLAGWKSERDVMRHPRKYLPPAAALLAVVAVHVLAP
ncbi:hypothetical protein HMPREF2883_01105 [Actinomyces sp. HMSC075C01]|uniref:Uncharacterized protein n=1 Tax=Actinomyces oris TaxID=544580 RepID=A0A1Q8VZK9_9ACTO|nr:MULTISPECIES: hypothetical protein [Actinomyces]OFR57821.1 hypothetical protein HMPREF2883_01105 [Actinomyces sp. HMSC075C01]OLO54025.1 hypothetical protein BKH27_05035 [Actinomyces oris]